MKINYDASLCSFHLINLLKMLKLNLFYIVKNKKKRKQSNILFLSLMFFKQRYLKNVIVIFSFELKRSHDEKKSQLSIFLKNNIS